MVEYQHVVYGGMAGGACRRSTTGPVFNAGPQPSFRTSMRASDVDDSADAQVDDDYGDADDTGDVDVTDAPDPCDDDE